MGKHARKTMKVLCVDIGNTSGHVAVVDGRTASHKAHIPTPQLDALAEGLPAYLHAHLSECTGIALCSVVPAATERVKALLQSVGITQPIFWLTHTTAPGLGFAYPKPQEVGPDRLADAIAAQALRGAPAIVIDMGTATTFTVITAEGYAGGIIGPGLAVTAQYLHEKTALLPKIDPHNAKATAAWGESTVEAMEIGCSRGYRGMIRELLAGVKSELALRYPGIGVPIYATGSNAPVVLQGLGEPVHLEPDLTLLGLAEAFRRTHNETA